ncbi:MAG: hypothetical protein ACK4K6_14395, partial [Pseudarthrobacter sp.]
MFRWNSAAQDSGSAGRLAGYATRGFSGAAKRMPAWTPKAPTGGWKKSGPGQSETERLLGYLAWGKGYARIHGGKQ